MNIHEYQAKDLLRSYGMPVCTGVVVETAEAAQEAARGMMPCVIKAQVHCGGRGKAGGVKLARSPEEAFIAADGILGMRIVNRQTGPRGRLVRKVLVTEAVDYRREMYLGMAIDNENAGLLIIASSAGGTEIEETAKSNPQAVARIRVSAVAGFRRHEGLRAAAALGLEGSLKEELVSLLAAMTRLCIEKDCSLIEINPLVETEPDEDGRTHLLCLDAKVNFDDNALFRHPDIAALRDIEEEDPNEHKASQFDLSYVSLDGDIGCLVNGAGLAMATMDIIKNFGGEPANFLDVGGSATASKVKAAFEILLCDSNVKAIFINIFGGIMKCDVIAQGVVEAASEIGISIPLVVRLDGTNVEKGRAILRNSGLRIISASDMADGARKAIAAARDGGSR